MVVFVKNIFIFGNDFLSPQRLNDLTISRERSELINNLQLKNIN